MIDTEKIEEYFTIYDREDIENGIRLYLHPKRESFKELKPYLLSLTSEFDVELKKYYGELVLEVKRRKTGENVWINVTLFLLTFISTTIMGVNFYGEINLIGGILFSIAILFVLGSHEMGHYIVAKRRGMHTSLPYFIPFPSLIGTLGAFIKHRGSIPDRRALFDVGVSGPIVGIIASVIVVAIGLNLPFHPKETGELIELGTPPLFDFIAYLLKYEGRFIHPIAIAGWVGMLVTFLNLSPVGQLDGGHVLRAMVGPKAEIVSRTVPFLLIALGGVLEFFYKVYSPIWVFWGLITLFFSMQRHPEPVDDMTPLDRKRIILGIIAFIVAALCFTPIPVQLAQNL
ncbi:MAG TPA: site-2 protease family protein [Archaeoglobaceae archaeon]|nr:site-2 protease family protein [Archaeoglobaceae archaeon]